MKYPLKTSILYIIMFISMLVMWFSPYDMLYPQIMPLHWIPEIIGLFVAGIVFQQLQLSLKIVLILYFLTFICQIILIGDIIYEFKICIFLENFMLLGYFTHYYYTNTKALNTKTTEIQTDKTIARM